MLLLKVDGIELSNALSKVMCVVNRNAHEDIHKCIKIEKVEDGFTVRAHNYDAGIIYKVEGDYEIEKDIVVNGNDFYNIIEKIKKKKITIEEVDNNVILISSGSFKSKIAYVDPSEFQNIDTDLLNATSFTIGADILISLLDSVKDTIYPDGHRYNINGAFFDITQDNINIVATDGHRLAVNKAFNIDNQVGHFLLPRKTVFDVAKLLNGRDCKVKVNFNYNKTQARFEFDNIIFISKLVDAEFPDYQRVIPSNNTNVVSCNKQDLEDAINRVSAIYGGTKGYAVDIDIIDGVMKLRCETELHNANDEIVCTNDTNISVKYNYKYLLHTLSKLDNEDVKIVFGESSQPFLLQDGNKLFVVMPVRQ